MSGSYATRLAVTVFALLVGGCDLFGEQTQRGRVLDQDTGEPIAGAIVVGRYMGGISWGGSSCNRAESAVSDAQGWFELPVDRKDGRADAHGGIQAWLSTEAIPRGLHSIRTSPRDMESGRPQVEREQQPV